MCQIVYSPKGDLMPREVFDLSRYSNPDGIGVMSERGPEKFLGRKAGKRAWRYLRALSAAGIPHGVHFRWATHGEVTRANCHPFESRDALIMHNGILSQTAKDADAQRSDTALFVERFMEYVPEPTEPTYYAFVAKLETFIGWANKFLMFHRKAREFTICNEDQGTWLNGFWYSNEWSLPSSMLDAADAADDVAELDFESDNWRDFDNDWRIQRDNWRDVDRRYPLPKLADEYADRNVRDAIGRQYGQDAYYRAIAHRAGYYDDGAELGARAAARAIDRQRIKAIDTGTDYNADYSEYERVTASTGTGTVDYSLPARRRQVA